MLIHDPMNDKTKIYQLFYSVRILKRFKWDVFKTIFSKQNETMLELIVIIDDSKNNSNNSNNGDNSKNKKNDDGNKVIMIIINSLLQRGKFFCWIYHCQEMFIHLCQINISTYQQKYLNDSTFRATGGGRMIVAMFNSITVKINDVFMCSGSKTVLK